MINYNHDSYVNDEHAKILFYLNLYRDNIKIQYQEKYYNNIDKESILKEIKNNNFFKNNDENLIYEEICNPRNYKLLNYIYKKNIIQSIDKNKYDFNNVDEFVRNLIKNRFNNK